MRSGDANGRKVVDGKKSGGWLMMTAVACHRLAEVD